MNYSELQKLYPDFRIPFEKESRYYLELLLKNNNKLNEQFHDFRQTEEVVEDIVKYKFAKFNEIIKYFTDQKWDLNLIDKDSGILNSGYSLKEFADYKPNKYYISVDLKEANWQAFQHAFNLSLSSFATWSFQTFDLLPAIAKSKSFRQFLFGNTNPKRLQRIQQSVMQKLYLSIYNDKLKFNIVGKRSDELLFEFDEVSENVWDFFEELYLSFQFKSILKSLPITKQFKITCFKVTEHTNFNEFIRIKEVYKDNDFKEPGERKLMSVPGNRFFIHYKTLILNEELEERDLFFLNDKHLAQWVL